MDTITNYSFELVEQSLVCSLFRDLCSADLLMSCLPHIGSWFFSLLLLLVVLRLWSIHADRGRDTSCPLPLPPGNMGYPFIGETINFLVEGYSSFYESRRAKFGTIYKTHILGNPTIRVIGANNVRAILHNEQKLLEMSIPSSAKTVIGPSSMVNSHGVLHHKRKKTVMRAFSRESLSSYVEPIQRIISKQIARWCHIGDILAYPECQDLTFSVVSKVLFGHKFSEENRFELLSTFNEMEFNLFSLPINVPGSGLNKCVRARNKMFGLIDECIQAKKASKDVDTETNLFSMLMNTVEGEDQLSEQEMKEVALELLFLGHATTASAACHMMMQLSQKSTFGDATDAHIGNPEVGERVLKELHDHGLMVGDLDMNSVGRLQYANNVIKEVLRIMPPVGAGFRKALETFELGGYQIPKGWTVMYGIRDTHETTPAFSDKTCFNPDRWQSNEGRTRSTYDYIPFGGGSRSCAGKEFAKLYLKILLIELVRGSSWRMINKSTEYRMFPVPQPKDNLPLHFTAFSDFRRRSFSL